MLWKSVYKDTPIVDKKIVEVFLSIDDLKCLYKPVSVRTTIQCAGNRRIDMQNSFKKEKSMPNRLFSPGGQYSQFSILGLPWQHSAISAAEWTGVRLTDFLL
ncbi:unnamed protein product, partial [Protopolystoma xenopodis]